MQQGNAATSASALYDGGSGGDAGGDAVMARWLQSAGLQHLASPNALMQGYGAQSVEEKQKIFKLLRNLNFNNGEPGSEPYTPTFSPTTSQSFGASDSFYPPDLRAEFGAGLLDLHAVDDTELLSEHVMPEPFEPSPFMPAEGFDDDFDAMSSRHRGPVNGTLRVLANEKESITKESNVAKIKVVVRKRPLNKKEMSRKEEDIVTVEDSSYVTVYEPKLKVDLTAYVEKHEFCFDAVLDENVTNDEVYRQTVEPIIPTIFQRTKATCFAYGQTGSGKTYTMQPLPLRAADDIVRLLHQPVYQNQKLKLWLSYFEIYGGKLFDLLSDRRKLLMREDGRQQVCIVGLQEFEVSDVQVVKEFIEKGNSSRSTGSTGANEESSRSHAILQLVIKKQKEVKDTRRQTRRQEDTDDSKGGKIVGKISFIDLAGSERGADTTDNDRQTRIEGAEINKSLLALKECIRALDNDQIHIPFRGSKLTEGQESLQEWHPKKDKESSFPLSAEQEELSERIQEVKPVEISTRDAVNFSYNSFSSEFDRSVSGAMMNTAYNGREENMPTFSALERERVNAKDNYISASRKLNSSTHSTSNTQDEEKVPKVSPPRRKVAREEKLERQSSWARKDSGSELPAKSYKNQQSYDSSRQYEQEAPYNDKEINAMLEEEEALIAAHRKEIENTMDSVREEMNLLAEVDQPGSLIDNYVTQLSFALSRKAAGLVSLQARLARFQHRLKEQEILSRKKAGPR